MKEPLGQAEGFNAGEKEPLEVFSYKISSMCHSDKARHGNSWMEKLVLESAVSKQWPSVMQHFLGEGR